MKKQVCEFVKQFDCEARYCGKSKTMTIGYTQLVKHEKRLALSTIIKKVKAHFGPELRTKFKLAAYEA